VPTGPASAPLEPLAALIAMATITPAQYSTMMPVKM
jgi:hypothetical protein